MIDQNLNAAGVTLGAWVLSDDARGLGRTLDRGSGGETGAHPILVIALPGLDLKWVLS